MDTASLDPLNIAAEVAADLQGQEGYQDRAIGQALLHLVLATRSLKSTCRIQSRLVARLAAKVAELEEVAP